MSSGYSPNNLRRALGLPLIGSEQPPPPIWNSGVQRGWTRLEPAREQPDLIAALAQWSERRSMIQRLDAWQDRRRRPARPRWRDGRQPMRDMQPTQRSADGSFWVSVARFVLTVGTVAGIAIAAAAHFAPLAVPG